MSSGSVGRLRVALLAPASGKSPPSEGEAAARELAAGLAALGIEPTIITTHRRAREHSSEGGFDVVRTRRLPEAPLRARGFVGALAQVPGTLAELRSGDYDLAHTFAPAQAQAALLWRRLGGGPVVFTCVDPPRREGLADMRWRLRITNHAFRASDSVTAASEEAQVAIRRWLALDVPLVGPADARAYQRTYSLLATRSEPAEPTAEPA